MPVTVENDLTLRVGKSTARLTPSEGFTIAEQLIRTSTRRLIAEEMGFAEPSPLLKAQSLRAKN